MVKETVDENEDKEKVAKMKTDGGGPNLGKRGRIEGTSSFKKGRERTKNQGNKRMDEDGPDAYDPIEPTS